MVRLSGRGKPIGATDRIPRVVVCLRLILLMGIHPGFPQAEELVGGTDQEPALRGYDRSACGASIELRLMQEFEFLTACLDHGDLCAFAHAIDLVVGAGQRRTDHGTEVELSAPEDLSGFRVLADEIAFVVIEDVEPVFVQKWSGCVGTELAVLPDDDLIAEVT